MRPAKWMAAVALTLATVALAGERFIGRVWNSDAGTSNNQNVLEQASFGIGAGNLLTLQCNVAAFVAVGKSGCDGGACISIEAGEKLPTSCPQGGALFRDGDSFSTQMSNYTLPDAGVYSGCLVAVKAMDAGATVHCGVWQRDGREGP